MPTAGTKKLPIAVSRKALDAAVRLVTTRLDSEPTDRAALEDTVHLRVHEGYLEVTAAVPAGRGWNRVRVAPVFDDSAVFSGVVPLDELRAVLDPSVSPAHREVRMWHESRGNQTTLRFARPGLEVAIRDAADRLRDNQQYSTNLIDVSSHVRADASTLELPQDLLLPALELTSWAMAREPHRYSLNTVQIQIRHKPAPLQLTIIGSDGKHLSAVRVAPERMPFPADTAPWGVGALLARDTVAFLLRVCQTYGIEAIRLTPLPGDLIRIEADEVVAVHHLNPGLYPPWQQVVPDSAEQEKKYTIMLKPPIDALREACRAMRQFSSISEPGVLFRATDGQLRLVQRRDSASALVIETECAVSGNRDGESVCFSCDPAYLEGALDAATRAGVAVDEDLVGTVPIWYRDNDSSLIWSLPLQRATEWFYLVMPVEDDARKRGELDLVFPGQLEGQ